MTTATPPRKFLERIPLPVRVPLYAVLFLAGLLAGLPWLAYRLDVHVPVLHVELPPPVRLAGWAVLPLLVGLYLWCTYRLTSRGQGNYGEWDPPKRFVADGPYRWVRNPIASCVVAILLVESIALSSTGLFLVFVLAIGLAHLQVTRLEEPLLRKRFGAEYEQYLRRVPRWIPRRPHG